MLSSLVCIFVLFQKFLYILDPGINLCLFGFQVIPAGGVELHFHVTGKFRTGTCFFHVLDDVARLAAVGHEWNNGFAAPVLAVQEGQDSRSHGIPPGRGSHGDDIVVIQGDV